MKEKAARRNEVKDVSKVLKIFTIHHSMAFESKKSRLMSIFWWNGLWLNISEGRLYVKEERTKSKPLKFDAFNLFWLTTQHQQQQELIQFGSVYSLQDWGKMYGENAL